MGYETASDFNEIKTRLEQSSAASQAVLDANKKTEELNTQMRQQQQAKTGQKLEVAGLVITGLCAVIGGIVGLIAGPAGVAAGVAVGLTIGKMVGASLTSAGAVVKSRANNDTNGMVTESTNAAETLLVEAQNLKDTSSTPTTVE